MPREELQSSYTPEEDFIQFTKDSLKFIMEKLELLSNDVEEIKQNMMADEKQRSDLKRIKTDVLRIKNTVQNFPSLNENSISELSAPDDDTAVKTVVSEETTNDETLQDRDEILALSDKQHHIQFWNQQLKFRRIAFWNMLKNTEKAKLYDRWIISEPRVIPRKLQIPAIKGEPENQRRRREILALEHFKAERDLLEMRGKYNEDKFKSIDLQIQSFWENKLPDSAFRILMEMWEKECLCEEQKSRQRWSKSESWFKKYETQFRENYKDQNPFLKTGKTEINNTNYRNHTNHGRHAGNPNFKHWKCPSYKTQMNNRCGSRPQIPFHERPYRRNFNRQESTPLRNNSFLGYGPRLNEIG